MASRDAAAGMRVRREVNLTAIFVTLIAVVGALGALYLLDALVLARQGLDVRGMLSLHLAPGQWGQAIGGALVAIAGAVSAVLAKILKRTNRTEALVGRRDEDRDARDAQLVALVAALHARFEETAQVSAEKDRRVAAAVAGMAGLFDTGVLATVDPVATVTPAAAPEPEPEPEPEDEPPHEVAVGEWEPTAAQRGIDLPPLPQPPATLDDARDDHDYAGVTADLLCDAPPVAETTTGTHVVRPYTPPYTPPYAAPQAPSRASEWDAILYGLTPPPPAPQERA